MNETEELNKDKKGRKFIYKIHLEGYWGK